MPTRGAVYSRGIVPVGHHLAFTVKAAVTLKTNNPQFQLKSISV